MSSLTKKTPLEMVQLAVSEHSWFKDVGRALKGERPSSEAAVWLAEAYRSGTSPPWMTAYLLGQNRHEEGYTTVKQILLSGPRQLAESYAGPALARINPIRALADLSMIVHEGSTRCIREGAAYGLGKIGGHEAVSLLIEALRTGKILELATSGILEPLLENEEELRMLLADEETRVARAGLMILECRGPRGPRPQLPSTQTISVARSALARISTSPQTRRALDELFAASTPQY